MFSFSLDTSLTHLRSSPRVSSPGKLAQQSRQFGTKVQAIWENVCGTLYIYICVCLGNRCFSGQSAVCNNVAECTF